VVVVVALAAALDDASEAAEERADDTIEDATEALWSMVRLVGKRIGGWRMGKGTRRAYAEDTISFCAIARLASTGRKK
jgi:hypothetical protein